MYLYLVLAFFWAALGVGLLVWHALDPRAPYRDMLGSGISAGWLGIVLAAYNLARWWSARSLEQNRTPPPRVNDGGEREGKAKEPGTPFDFGEPRAGAERRP
jgi:hypothetical protein